MVPGFKVPDEFFEMLQHATGRIIQTRFVFAPVLSTGVYFSRL